MFSRPCTRSGRPSQRLSRRTVARLCHSDLATTGEPSESSSPCPSDTAIPTGGIRASSGQGLGRSEARDAGVPQRPRPGGGEPLRRPPASPSLEEVLVGRSGLRWRSAWEGRSREGLLGFPRRVGLRRPPVPSGWCLWARSSRDISWHSCSWGRALILPSRLFVTWPLVRVRWARWVAGREQSARLLPMLRGYGACYRGVCASDALVSRRGARSGRRVLEADAARLVPW